MDLRTQRVLPTAWALWGCGDGASPDSCGAGLVDRGEGCVDVDECAVGTHTCDPEAACVNEPGAYRCLCPAGFSGRDCDNIDECAEGLDDCDPIATCIDTEGAYRCRCPEGSIGDGVVCEDIDECALGLHDCSQPAACIDEAPGFRCALASSVSWQRSWRCVGASCTCTRWSWEPPRCGPCAPYASPRHSSAGRPGHRRVTPSHIVATVVDSSFVTGQGMLLLDRQNPR